MRAIKAIATGLAVVFSAGSLAASGPVGVYAMIDKVVLEPNAQAPQRIQVWGAFAFVDGGIQGWKGATGPQRGYFYFMMPPASSEAQKEVIRKEWADLRAIAGSGQAVAFGNWAYIGGFGERMTVYASVRTGPNSSRGVEVSVQPESPKLTDPVPYSTNTGIVKLAASGSNAAIVQQLKNALKR